MSEIIEAPFTPEQVQALNNYQLARYFHPFTCGRRDLPGHDFKNGDYGVLIATEAGWVCPDCDYTQSWAHAFMAGPLPPNPFLPKEFS